MRRAYALAVIALLSVLSTGIATAGTVRCPPRGATLFTVALPEGWRSRAVEASNEIRADSAARDIELAIEVSHASVDDSRIDDEIAHLVDASFTKVEFSNLHQRRLVNGRRVVVFRGSGRDRSRGTKTSFEIFAFSAAGKTGLLFFRFRTPSPKTTETLQAIVESIEPTSG